jgi:hypothetical protein
MKPMTFPLSCVTWMNVQARNPLAFFAGCRGAHAENGLAPRYIAAWV